MSAQWSKMYILVSLVASVAYRSIKHKLESFNASMVARATWESYHEEAKKALPIDVLTAQTEQAITVGIEAGYFKEVENNKVILTPAGEFLGVAYVLNSQSSVIDVERN